jgi:hypothetical protein
VDGLFGVRCEDERGGGIGLAMVVVTVEEEFRFELVVVGEESLLGRRFAKAGYCCGGGCWTAADMVWVGRAEGVHFVGYHTLLQNDALLIGGRGCLAVCVSN